MLNNPIFWGFPVQVLLCFVPRMRLEGPMRGVMIIRDPFEMCHGIMAPTDVTVFFPKRIEAKDPEIPMTDLGKL